MKMNAEHMLKMCLKKKRYRSLDFAKNRAKEYSKKFETTQYVYLCTLCGAYHITTHKHEGAYYYYIAEAPQKKS